MPNYYQVVVANIPEPGSADQPSQQGSMKVKFECDDEGEDSAICGAISALSSMGALIPVVGPLFGGAGAAVNLACSQIS